MCRAAKKPTVVAVGPGGSAWSADDGATWVTIDTLNYWSVGFASPRAGWAVGTRGKITRLGGFCGRWHDSSNHLRNRGIPSTALAQEVTASGGRRGSHFNRRSVSLALMYTLHFGRALAVAVLSAVLINYLFSPAVRWLAKRRVPRSLSAFVLLAGLAAAIAGTTAALAVPAANWVARAPAALQKAQSGIAALKTRVRKASAVASTLEKVTALEEPKNEVVISRAVARLPRLREHDTLLGRCSAPPSPCCS